MTLGDFSGLIAATSRQHRVAEQSNCPQPGLKNVKFDRDWVERLERTETRGRFERPEDKAEVLALFRNALEF